MALAGAEKSYSKIFFVASHIFVLLALYSLYDEAVVRRPWKAYQEEFNSYELQLAEKELQKIQEKFKKGAASKKIAALELEIEKLETYKISDEYEALQKTHKKLQQDYDDFEQGIKFNKSILDAHYYTWKHGLQERKPAATVKKYEKQYKDLEALIAADTEKLAEMKVGLDEAQKGVDAPNTKIDALVAKIDKIKAPVVAAEEVVKNIKLRPVDIKQVVLDYGVQKQGNIKWGRVDRCQTCHVAVDKGGYENVAKAWKLKVLKDQATKDKVLAKKPHLKNWVITKDEAKYLQTMYGTHPQRQEMLVKHPVEKFGCTTCHAGNGRGVNIHGEAFGHHDKAHAYHHHAVAPLLRGQQMESNCLTCHQGLVQLEMAPNLTKGAELFSQLGCQNCHAVKGYEGMYKVGPALHKVGAKVTNEWLVDWLKNPFDYMPSSRMPNFGLSDDDVVAISSYLVSQSGKHNVKRQYALNSGNAVNGKKLFNRVGCQGCHAIDEGSKVRGRASNLARVAAKVQDPQWIADWIKDPENYNAHARMPNLRLTDSEATDITAYLLSLSPGYEKIISKRSGALAKKVDPSNQELVAKGKKIIGHRGCYSCHEMKGYEGYAQIGANLTAEAVKSKTKFDYGDALAANYQFKDVFGNKVYVGHLDKIRDADGHKGHVAEKAGELTKDIEKRVKDNYKVEIDAIKPDRITNLQYDWQSWIRNKMRYPLSIYAHERAELRMPNFNLTEEELDALLVFIKGLQNMEVPPEYNAMLKEKHQNIREGQWLVAEKNCMGCHSVGAYGGDINAKLPDLNHEGEKLKQFNPPSLTHVGMKIRPEWLRSFLKAPFEYRPHAYIRMPSYGFSDDELDVLSSYFASLNDRRPSLTDTDYKLDSKLVAIGGELASPKGLNCFLCHYMNGKAPSDDPRNWAPDWVKMKSRLQYDFIPDWIKNPVAYQDHSVMSPWLNSDEEAHPDYLGGSAEKQLDALREYILSVGKD